MSSGRRGNILNPHSRYQRISESLSLPITIPSAVPQERFIDKVYSTGKQIVNSISSSFLSYLFPIVKPNTSALSPQSSSNIDSKTPRFTNIEENMQNLDSDKELPIKRLPSFHNNPIIKKKKIISHDTEAQTDMPYQEKSNIIKNSFQNPLKNNKKLNDSSGEMDTKGTDEEEEGDYKNARQRAVVKKILRGKKNIIDKGPGLEIIPERNEMKANCNNIGEKSNLSENGKKNAFVSSQMLDFKPQASASIVQPYNASLFGNGKVQNPGDSRKDVQLFPNSLNLAQAKQDLTTKSSVFDNKPIEKDVNMLNPQNASINSCKENLLLKTTSESSLFPALFSQDNQIKTNDKPLNNALASTKHNFSMQNKSLPSEIINSGIKPDTISIMPANSLIKSEAPNEIIIPELPAQKSPIIEILEPSKPVEIISQNSSNPFLNASSAKTIGIPYKFGENTPLGSSPLPQSSDFAVSSPQVIQTSAYSPTSFNTPNFQPYKNTPSISNIIDIDMEHSNQAPSFIGTQLFQTPSSSNLNTPSLFSSPDQFKNSPSPFINPIPQNPVINNLSPFGGINQPTLFQSPSSFVPNTNGLFAKPSDFSGSFNSPAGFLSANSLPLGGNNFANNNPIQNTFGGSGNTINKNQENKGFSLGVVTTANKRQRK